MQYATNLVSSSPPPPAYSSRAAKKDAACQTLSTGDIVITKIFFKEDQDKQEKVLISSPQSQKFWGIAGSFCQIRNIFQAGKQFYFIWAQALDFKDDLKGDPWIFLIKR